MSRVRAVPHESLVRIPTHFAVGPHTVTVMMGTDWRWSVSVDAAALPNTFETQVEAWEAGVREADRRDKLPPA